MNIIDIIKGNEGYNSNNLNVPDSLNKECTDADILSPEDIVF